MGAAESLAAWGVLRAAEVVEVAAGAGLELASAAAMLEKESSGGRNVWGSDGVQTGGFYVKGAEVERAAYEAWLPHRSRLGSQGVGPTQLTYPPLQDQADRLGGCWDWRINLTVGCRHLAALQQQYGVRDGFRRYNGSGSAAERYADDAMAKRARWHDRLGRDGGRATTTTTPTTTPTTDWFDMATKDELRAVLLDTLRPYLDPTSPGALALRSDVKYARDQQAAVIDFNPKLEPEDLTKGPSVLGLLHQLVTHQDPGAAEPLDYNRLARSMVAVLMEAASAHQTGAEDPTSTGQPPT